MSELSDDIARGCLENGEPIEARWGTGEWSAQPEQQQEPDPWEEALAAAHIDGAIEALDKAIEMLSPSPLVNPFTILIQLKSEYLKGQGNDGQKEINDTISTH